MNRRDAVLALFALGAAPLAQAQQSANPVRIGFLGVGNSKAAGYVVEALKQRLRELGYVEGKNAMFEIRWAEANGERLPELAAELVRLKADLIFSWATAATLAAKKATTAVPIVMVGVADPVGSHLVASLARPGGNVTGVSNISRDLSGKLVEMLVQAVPRITRFAALSNALNPSSVLQVKETEAAAQSLGLQLQLIHLRTLADFEPAFASMTNAHSMGLVVMPDPVFIGQRRRIAELAIKHRLPSVFARRENVEAGGLLSYGPSLLDQIRVAAGYVDKILKGANPAELPIELPTRLELVVNIRTANALGIGMPASLLVRADELIQ